MKHVILITAFFAVSLSAKSQALTYVKSLCENKARSWMENIGCTYRGNLTVSDVTELGDNRLKVTGRFDYNSSNCGNRTCTFEVEMKKILDEMEITSMCRNAPFCAMGMEYNTEWRCYPN